MKQQKRPKKQPEPDKHSLIRLQSDFFQKDATVLAKDLLGKHLIYNSPAGEVGGIITEVEAYLGNQDLAAHSFKGKNKKNWALFGPAGSAYIYFTYGVHYCFNVVANDIGVGEGVLIRSLEPTHGLEVMKQNRKSEDIYNLTTGPGKLVQALGLDPKLNGSDLTTGPIGIYQSPDLKPVEIEISTRIGISRAQDSLLRFLVKNNQFISGKIPKKVA